MLIYGLGILKVHEKLYFGDESALVSCIVVWKMVCTSVLTTVVVRVPCLVLLGSKLDIMGRQEIVH
jgi:hypothetical protein